MALCAECRWFTPNGYTAGDNLGICKARSPSVLPSDWEHTHTSIADGGRMKAVWPVVTGTTAGCGDYRGGDDQQA